MRRNKKPTRSITSSRNRTHSKYQPHQGEQEKARRRRQMGEE